MDLPVPLDYDEKWTKEKESMIAKHEEDLAFHENLLEKEKQELRESSERDLLKLKAAVPLKLYREIILPMAEKSLRNDMQQIEASHQTRTAIIEKEQKAKLARHEIAYHEEQKVKLAMDGERSAYASINCSFTSQLQDSKKRKASLSKEEAPKRQRIEKLMSCPQTPAAAPLDASTHSPARTITFDEVYQNGKAKHKDTIVEWPNGSNKWYILKCEKHKARFTKNAVQGAARHLNGLSHGFTDRNRDVAVKTLGYLVVDCNEKLAKVNNEAADEAYANGYKPPLAKTKRQPEKRDGAQKRKYKKRMPKLGADSTTKKPGVKGRQISDTPASCRTSSQKLITNPKTFMIYYGRWKSTNDTKDHNEIYPVMILGWDSQDGSGLKNTNLEATGLLNKSAFPPNCYLYESNKIVGWAPGYEDGGAKVDSRKFPVMFFDEFQTVAWISARYLTRFPLYDCTPPSKPDHPFNAARRWIAEREGFSTWEQREKARLYPLMSRPPSISPITPIGNEFTNAIIQPGGHGNRESHPTSTTADSTVDKDDLESIGSNSEMMSISTADTEMIVEEWREKGGEIPGDDDYSGSGSDTENNVEHTIDEWDRLLSDAPEPNGSSDRPWAFYGLRSIENNEEKNTADRPREPGESQSSIPVAAGVKSARGPARQTSSCTVNPPEFSESRSLETPEASHEIQLPVHLDNTPLGYRAASAPQPETGSSTLPELNGDKGIRSLSREISSEVTWKAGDKVQCDPHGNIKASVRTREAVIDSKHDNTRWANEIKMAGEGCVESEQTTIEESIHVAHQKEDENKAREHRETQLPSTETANSSINPAITTTAPTATRSVRNPFADTTTPPGSPEFELSQCSNGETSWKRSNEEEDCVKLYHDRDRNIFATWRGPVDVTIELMEVTSFSRESIPVSEGNSILMLNTKGGSSWKLIFDQSKGSDLLAGKIQSRRFIRQLRSANPDIVCLDTV
ncbi:uncharacterized protein F4812DRAFT_425456 [Daldinia caldariorum]|uniref:uncharacterized protein n=1 Tax=Daldinia caldariorum TaxID=326644 RepID=UPI002008BD1F|nr:uncharacterized protein F4812DRAFT_425456 [Daldinia caldariorum]KAI1469013.1 hypothetical protein F4812DRAFT_425456 [Daldinia caldariorum]